MQLSPYSDFWKNRIIRVHVDYVYIDISNLIIYLILNKTIL